MVRVSPPGVLSNLVMEEVTDPVELAKARVRWAQVERNADWLKAHAQEIYAKYGGKCICVAGQELFVADDPVAVVAQARAAHPEDGGFLFRYLPAHNQPRIYAYRYAC
jgi:hypothetical protein